MLLVLSAPLPGSAQLRGHGGPVRALAIAPDGRLAISGGFDHSGILWAIDQGTALSVLRFHDGAVNAVAALDGGRFVTASEDGRIALWQAGRPEPVEIFSDHAGPIAALAVSPDGASLASASWDGTAHIRFLAGGPVRVLRGHAGNVNAVAFLPDGRLVTGSYDATLRVWSLAETDEPPRIVQLPSPVNSVAVAGEGEIVAAGADSVVRFLSADGTIRASVDLATNPVIGLALSPDGRRVAAATVAGTVAMIDRRAAKVAFSLVGPGLPVWSLAFRPDGTELLTGGGDRLVRRWNAGTGEPIGSLSMPRPVDSLAAFKGDHGAEVFRACVACHTLTPEDGTRAGPTLSGVFGRRVATAEGYTFSQALKGLDIVWDARTISKLFEIGPSRYTPGTKMPEQTINNPDDREALVRFLERATKTP
ncbi:c-type cytochrome [Methylobacterium sp. SD274]|uniref:c-type cytochrome n=1 Tax=Methylobacterium sp. SD274 TaxID=2782009 RepID=UPI001A9607BE|nr:c-type cytochrome [Methylobacterium sp. SD274]MBO1021720.1 c-type cytochrome [Methylobacterium sp. SD274]